MSDTIENTKDLDASRTEALQGLLRSLGHTNSDPTSGATLTTEQRRKLSEQVHEILGDDAGRELTPIGGQPSQPLNEDGLPIIDISEPINGSPQMSTSSSSLPEQGPTPFTPLPPDERERRRRERDRILDLLEEEERLQQLQEERNAVEERREAIRKRKESAKAELDRLKAARELQKKMGQALVRQTRGAENRRGENTGLKHQTTSSPAKKSVSFVDAPVVKANERDQQTPILEPNWGEVAPGKLRAQSRVPLVSTAEAQKYPMKMRVVERHSTAPPTSPFHGGADSDDESTSSAGYLASCMENGSSDEEDRPSASNNDLSDDEPLEEGFDYDTAQHHREIALEYHKQRHATGAETARALAAHTLDGYEQHETSDGQVPVSRFRANRMAAAYDKSFGSISTSIGQAVIPSSRQKSLRNSVRLGKLENDQLVGGGSGESGSEDETIKEVIQMLKMGGIQNAGPNFKLSSTSAVAPPQNSDAVESLPRGTPIAVHGAKPSRFKLAHGGIPETTTFQDNKSWDKPRSQLTVSSVVERKSPRSLSSQRLPIGQPPLRLPVQMSQSTPSMIIDSPSFPMTASTSTVNIPSSSPRTTTTGSPSPHQMQFARPPLVKSSAAQDPMIRPQVPTRDPSVQCPAPKFIVERKKMID